MKICKLHVYIWQRSQMPTGGDNSLADYCICESFFTIHHGVYYDLLVCT